MGNLQPCGRTASNRSKISEYRKQRDGRIMNVKQRLQCPNDAANIMRQRICAMDFETLRKALQREEVRATDALDAYMWKAMKVNEEINCVAEFLIEAFDYATHLDTVWKGIKEKPPLFGVPFSVKSNFHMEGYDCCMGLGKFLFQPMKEECTFVTHLRSLGAVPFVLTNVPQALLSFECSNSVYGTTGNPNDVNRTPGGSSGGECALLKAKGCVFGIGSDLAGSLRIPPTMCGLVSIKPTDARFVVEHTADSEGKGRLSMGYGYFTHTVAEQIFLLSQTLGSESYCALVPSSAPIPLNMDRIRKVAEKKRLRIGYFTDDGFLKPVPACSNVVKETVEKLKAAGHEVISFRIPNPMLAASLFYKNLMPDGGDHTRDLFAHDVVSPYMNQFVTILSLPKSFRTLGGWALKSSSPQMSVVAGSYMANLNDVFTTNELTDQYITQFTEEFKGMSLDALVCPAFTVPAVPHEFPSMLGACALTTGLYNMLNYPAGVLPVREVTERDDAELEDDTIWPVDGNIVLKTMRKAAKSSKGLPLAVQVVTLPFQEEECLAVMQIIEKLWKS